jgi:hypothetical protein
MRVRKLGGKSSQASHDIVVFLALTEKEAFKQEPNWTPISFEVIASCRGFRSLVQIVCSFRRGIWRNL